MAKKVQETGEIVDKKDEVLAAEVAVEEASSELIDETAAADTLRPNSMPVGPANKSAAIGKIVNAFAGMSPEAINGFWEMINGVGHEADSLPNNKEKNKASVEAKPSDASTANIAAQDHLVRKEDFDLDVKAVIAEDLSNIFEGEEIADETKEKFAVLFEAAVNLKSAKKIAELEEAFEAQLDEEAETMAENLAEALESYVETAVGTWYEQNEVAIESTLHRDLTDEFLDDIRAVFEKHYVDVPDDKVDVVAEMATRIEELEKLATEQMEAIDEIAEERDELAASIEANKVAAELVSVAEGLTESDVEKLNTLVEGIEYSDVADFRRKAEIIRESHFKKIESAPSINKSSVLFEETEQITEETAEPKLPGNMAAYVGAIKHQVRK